MTSLTVAIIVGGGVLGIFVGRWLIDSLARRTGTRVVVNKRHPTAQKERPT